VATNTEKAISFAASMVRKGEYLGKALSVAANYYGVPWGDVQRGMAARSGKSQKGKSKPRKPKPPRACCWCNAPATHQAAATWAYRVANYWYTCDEHKGQSEPWREPSDRYDSIKWTKYAPDKESA
jgi:hypothetical protein